MSLVKEIDVQTFGMFCVYLYLEVEYIFLLQYLTHVYVDYYKPT